MKFINKKTKILSYLPQIIAMLFLAGFIAYAWTEPPSTPPGGNVPAPINVGSASQLKSGALGVGGVLQAFSDVCIGGVCKNVWPAEGLGGSGIVNYVSKFTGASSLGNSQIFDNGTNIGIGTASPGAKLEVAGYVKITDGSQGLNKVLTSDAGGLANWQNVPPSPQGLYGRVELNYNSVACGIQTNGTYPVSCGSLAPGQCVVAGTQIVGASGNVYNCNWYGPSCLAGYQVVDVFPYVFSTNYPNKRISVCYKF